MSNYYFNAHPMYYFVIFNKQGLILYEDGVAPIFINNIVQGISPIQTSGSKRIRDDIMEYEIRGQIVYLSINRTAILESKILYYEPYIQTLIKENQKSENNDQINYNLILTDEKIEEINNNNNITNNNIDNIKKDIKKDEDILDFSDKSSKFVETVKDIKNMNFKRAFNLFSNKIELTELRTRMIEHLIKKNVDSAYSKLITEEVISEFKRDGVSYIGEAEFKTKMSKILEKIIPKIKVNGLLNKIREYKGVYSICFIGVNGVGKSTSLAKVACWLLQNGFKVFIAACDTFRAGAIEQLKVHVDRFKTGGHDVGFYESGYAKDDAAVAKAAILNAQRENYDVILIDTAGRMHRKENLMQSLSKIIRVNKPDHILFVGEALVGGDSLAHIKEFNNYISKGSEGRRIDSIILTKIDTVDDKIGQVLNLSFSASAPILFLGVGQTNSDLMPMDPKSIGELLMS